MGQYETSLFLSAGLWRDTRDTPFRGVPGVSSPRISICVPPFAYKANHQCQIDVLLGHAFVGQVLAVAQLGPISKPPAIPSRFTVSRRGCRAWLTRPQSAWARKMKHFTIQTVLCCFNGKTQHAGRHYVGRTKSGQSAVPPRRDKGTFPGAAMPSSPDNRTAAASPWSGAA